MTNVTVSDTELTPYFDQRRSQFNRKINAPIYGNFIKLDISNKVSMGHMD